jgi:hypothetical protein
MKLNREGGGDVQNERILWRFCVEREKETAAGDLVLRERDWMKAILRGERDGERS